MLVPSIKVKKFGQRLIDLCKIMVQFMETDDGIGLAAPQICYNLNLITLGNSFSKSSSLQHARFKLGSEELGYVLVNPRVKSRSEKKVDLLGGEGCLSLKHADLGKIERNEWIIIEYQNLDGDKFEEKVSGYLSTVISHEIDHLEGILYPGRMKESERNALLARYIRSKNLKQIEVVNATKLMLENVKNYEANYLSEIEYDIDQMVEFANKIKLPEVNLKKMLENIAWINDEV